MSSEKISLVTRRKDKAFDAPTRASERAKARTQPGDDAPVAAGKDTGKDVSVSFEDGAPTVQVEVPTGRRLDAKEIVAGYLHGTDKGAATAVVSREIVNGKLGLKFQFMPEHASKMLTVKQLATMLGVSEHTILALRKSGRIKAYHVGRGWRFIWAEVVAALEDKGKE